MPAACHTGAWWFSVVSVIGIVVTLVGGWIRRQTIRYVVSDRRIGIRTGIVSRNERTTHLNRVQNVAMRQGVIQRLMGIGDVDWDTAGHDRERRRLHVPWHRRSLTPRASGRPVPLARRAGAITRA